MKGSLCCFAGTLLLILQINQTSCQKTKAASQSLLPLAVGNEWIYRDSVYENNKLISVSIDTERISGSSMFEGHPAWLFSDGRELMLKGDTLYQLVKQRNAVKFPTKFFVPTETETHFNYAFGGDVLKQRTVTKMKECPKNSFSVSTCYQISESCGKIIFGYGTGILTERKNDCREEAGNYTVRTLIDVKFNK